MHQGLGEVVQYKVSYITPATPGNSNDNVCRGTRRMSSSKVFAWLNSIPGTIFTSLRELPRESSRTPSRERRNTIGNDYISNISTQDVPPQGIVFCSNQESMQFELSRCIACYRNVWSFACRSALSSPGLLTENLTLTPTPSINMPTTLSS
jgi:hypothetical protein